MANNYLKQMQSARDTLNSNLASTDTNVDINKPITFTQGSNLGFNQTQGKQTAQQQTFSQPINVPITSASAQNAMVQSKDNPSWFINAADSVWNFAKETGQHVMQKYINPLITYSQTPDFQQKGLLGLALDEANKNVQNDAIVKQFPEALGAAAVGLYKGITLGWSPTTNPLSVGGMSVVPALDLNNITYTNPGSKTVENISKFLTYMIPYGASEKLLQAGATKFIPEFVINHPGLVRRVSEALSFVGTSQLSKDAFTLTPEEQAAGMTITQKRLMTAAMDATALGVFKGMGTIFNAMGFNGLQEMKSQVEDTLKQNAINELKNNVDKINLIQEGKITPSRGLEYDAVAMEQKLNLIDSVNSPTDPQSQNIIDNARAKVESFKENNPDKYIEQKFVQGAPMSSNDNGNPISNISDISAEYINSQTNVPVNIVSNPIQDTKAIRSSLLENKNNILDSINNKNVVDINQLLKDNGYKDYTDLEIRSISQARQTGITADEIVTGFSKPSLEGNLNISVENITPEEAVKDNLKNMLFDKFSADAGISGMDNNRISTIRSKSLLKRLLSYGDTSPEILSTAFKSIDSIKDSSKISEMISRTLDILSNDAYEKLILGESPVFSRKIDSSITGSILDKFIEKGTYTNTELANSIIEAFGKKQAGSNPFNTANKLVQQFGFSDVKDFAKTIEDSTGITLTNKNALAITGNESENIINDLAKKSGNKDGLDMMVKLKEKKLDAMDNNPVISSRDLYSDLGDSQAVDNLIITNQINKAESQHSIQKGLDAGFITIPGGNNATAEAQSQVISDFFGSKKSWWEGTKQTFKNLSDAAQRVGRTIFAEPEVDKSISKNYPMFVVDKIDMWNIPRVQMNRASEMVSNVMGGLDEGQVDTFRKVAMLSDFVVTQTRGKDIPVPIEEVYKELERLRPMYMQSKEVQDSIVRHFRLMKAFRQVINDNLGQRGFEEGAWTSDISQSAKDEVTNYLRQYTGISNLEFEDVYVPHVVAKYANEEMMGKRWIPSVLKKQFNGFLKERKGSMEQLITDYEKITTEYAATTMTTMAMDKKMVEMAIRADVRKSMTDDEARAINQFINKPGQIFNADDLPDSIKHDFPSSRFMTVQIDRGNYIYPLDTIDKKKIDALLQDGLSIEDVFKNPDELTKRVLAIGRKKPIFLVPEEIGKQINKFNTPMESSVRDAVRLISPYIRNWKMIATKYYGGIAWRAANSIQDEIRTLTMQPTTLNDFPQALRIASKLVYGDSSKMDLQTQEFIKKLEEYHVDVSGFLNNLGSRSVIKPTENILKYGKEEFDTSFNNLSSSLELTPKISSILDNLKRIESGKSPIFVGSDDYIKSLYNKGFVEEAVYSYGRGITIDYAAMPPVFRKYFSGLIAPFSFWFVRNGAGIMRMMKDAPQRAIEYLGFLTATSVWNNLGENARYEQGLTDYQRNTPHINLGTTESGKAITLYLDNPINQAMSILGLNQLPAIVSDAITGSDTPDRLAYRLFNMIPSGISTFTTNMINPIIKNLTSLVVNKDVRTQQQIVPDNLKGTTQGLGLGLQYFMSGLFTPLQQAMIESNKVDFNQNPEKFVQDLLLRPLDISRPFINNQPASKLLFNQEYGVAKDLSNEQTTFHQNMFNSFVSGDMQLFKSQMNDLIASSPDPDVAVKSFLTYMTSPAVEANVIKEIQKRVTDTDKQDALENAYYQMRRVINLQSVRNDLLPKLLQRLQ